ncbi:hypothetical protein EYF80_056948 [Liparis tanakae]|uniref:Uncharacterized protein n=1 Tax=Liparis tanakae TaxID=230148 RepID=A0A4Z2EW66_9TELE|nr:hypothetical protein EYF80_056948 [Liparis tanakae]
MNRPRPLARPLACPLARPSLAPRSPLVAHCNASSAKTRSVQAHVSRSYVGAFRSCVFFDPTELSRQLEAPPPH